MKPTAMILAAGLGLRLRPITEKCPKALCTINNIPLIEHHVLNLARAGFERIIINHAHLGGKIRQHLGNGQRFNVEIHYSPEPPGGLETAGGIMNALPLLGNQPFLAVNADIFTDFPFTFPNLTPPYLMHLVLTKTPTDKKQGDFGLSEQMHVVNAPKELTFTGIACYHPTLFKGLPIGRYSLTPLLRTYADKQLVSGEIHTGFWLDIGTPQKLQQANEERYLKIND